MLVQWKSQRPPRNRQPRCSSIRPGASRVSWILIFVIFCSLNRVAASTPQRRHPLQTGTHEPVFMTGTQTRHEVRFLSVHLIVCSLAQLQMSIQDFRILRTGIQFQGNRVATDSPFSIHCQFTETGRRHPALPCHIAMQQHLGKHQRNFRSVFLEDDVFRFHHWPIHCWHGHGYGEHATTTMSHTRRVKHPETYSYTSWHGR